MHDQANQPDEFNDPQLKAALSRALGRDTASADLRSRLAKIMAPAESPRGDSAADGVSSRLRLVAPPSPLRRRFWIGNRKFFALAAAAVLVIGLFVALRAYDRAGSDVGPDSKLADALVRRHDSCCAALDHHMFGKPTDTPADLSKALVIDLKHPVISTALADGWTFCGAGLCPVNNIPTAHLLFFKGPDSVSLISIEIPESQRLAMIDGKVYDRTSSDGHTLASMRRGAVVFAAVGYSKSGPAPDVDAVLRHVASSVTARGSTPQVAVRELALALATPGAD